MPTPVDILRRQLELEAASSPARPPLVYSGPADFVLQHGEWMTPTECLPGIPQHCYQNAIGCRDPATGAMYEVTWPIPGRAYIGVVFSAVRADDATWNGDGSVLHDWKRAYPLFRERWTGETWHTTEDREALGRLGLAVALTGESFDPRIFWVGSGQEGPL